jgi:hypothetical protein
MAKGVAPCRLSSLDQDGIGYLPCRSLHQAQTTAATLIIARCIHWVLSWSASSTLGGGRLWTMGTVMAVALDRFFGVAQSLAAL